MPSSTIHSRGQITVPAEVRKRLGLKPGDRVEFGIEGDRIILCRALGPENAFLKYVGVLPAFSTVREVNDWVCALRSESEK